MWRLRVFIGHRAFWLTPYSSRLTLPEISAMTYSIFSDDDDQPRIVNSWEES